jgi:hypothetical protein
MQAMLPENARPENAPHRRALRAADGEPCRINMAVTHCAVNDYGDGVQAPIPLNGKT